MSIAVTFTFILLSDLAFYLTLSCIGSSCRSLKNHYRDQCNSRNPLADCPAMSFVFVSWQINIRNTNQLGDQLAIHVTHATNAQIEQTMKFPETVGKNVSIGLPAPRTTRKITITVIP